MGKQKATKRYFRRIILASIHLTAFTLKGRVVVAVRTDHVFHHGRLCPTTLAVVFMLMVVVHGIIQIL
jgi:hypothetical protein